MGGGAVQNLMEEGGGGLKSIHGRSIGEGGGVKNAVEKYA